MIFKTIKRLFCVILCLVAVSAGAEINYASWERASTKAQELISEDATSEEALDTLRAQLVVRREEFAKTTSENAAEISTLMDQIAALGPAPEEGQAQDDPLVARRADLSNQLAELSAPGLRAQEALQQVNGMISQIDQILRTRQAEMLLHKGELPFSVAFWRKAWGDMLGSITSIVVPDTASRGIKRERLPLTLLASVFGLFLLLRGRQLALDFAEFGRAHTRRGSDLWETLAEILKAVLPFCGIVSIALAVQSATDLGLARNRFLEDLIFVAGIFLASTLFLRLIFPPKGEGHLQGSGPARTAMRFWGGLVAFVFGLRVMLWDMAQFDGWNTQSFDGWNFALIALGAMGLWHMAPPLRAVPDESHTNFVTGMAHNIGRILSVVAVLAVVLPLFGYHNAADILTFRSIATLFFLALLLVFQRILASLWVLFVEGGAQDRDGLVPTLLGLALSLGALPVLALIWGARLTDISELWSRFLRGFTLGDTTISPGMFATFAIVFSIGYLATRMLKNALARTVLPKTRINAGGRNALVSGLGYVGIFLSAVIAITTAGMDLGGLALVAGALSVGIGFGLQNIISNFVSGLILLIERPISIGDWVEVGGQEGYVRAISVRSTHIETFNRTDVIVPNADFISGHVVNYTRSNTIGRMILPVGVAYGTDTRRVETILLEVVRDMPNVFSYPAPYVVFQGFGASTYDLELRVFLRDVNNGLSTRTELNHRIRECFEREEIEIAFPQQDLWIRNPEALGATKG